LYERGFIDPSKGEKNFTLTGKKDTAGNVVKETSLNHLMSIQYDFAHETTLLQHHGTSMGVIVDRFPKCHPEIAGEGIEYSWGRCKNMYRALPLSSKKSKELFKKSMAKVLSRTEV
jgi:hypothetical protein